MTPLDEPFLYPIVDVEICEAARIAPLALVDAILEGGARVVQIRQKSGGSAALLDLARRAVAAGRHAGAVVIVNDRADIARLAGAAGVHVGQDDLAVDEARAVAGGDAIVGLSTHDAAQVDRALAGAATYVAVGPVYGTRTKSTGYTPRGLSLVSRAARGAKPVVAIGGISLERVPELVAAGARGLAVISDLLSTGDPARRVREYLERLDART